MDIGGSFHGVGIEKTWTGSRSLVEAVTHSLPFRRSFSSHPWIRLGLAMGLPGIRGALRSLLRRSHSYHVDDLLCQ